LAGFVDFLAGKANLCGRGFSVLLLWKNGASPKAISSGCDFAALLRGVVFVGEVALRKRLDFLRAGLMVNIGGKGTGSS
jgi:hypothetical protein